MSDYERDKFRDLDKLEMAKAQADKIQARLIKEQGRVAGQILADRDPRPLPLPEIDLWANLPEPYEKGLTHFAIDEAWGGHQKLEAAYAKHQQELNQAKMKALAAQKLADQEREKLRIEANRVVYKKIWMWLVVLPVAMQAQFNITEDGFIIGNDTSACECGWKLKLDLVPNLNFLLDNPRRVWWLDRFHRHNPVKEKPYADFVSGTRSQDKIGVFFNRGGMTDAALGRPVTAVTGITPEMAEGRDRF
jgi:hypothetical protein